MKHMFEGKYTPFIKLEHMGGNYQYGKHNLSVSILSVFMVTWSQNEPPKDWKKYINESTGIALL